MQRRKREEEIKRDIQLLSEYLNSSHGVRRDMLESRKWKAIKLLSVSRWEEVLLYAIDPKTQLPFYKNYKIGWVKFSGDMIIPTI